MLSKLYPSSCLFKSDYQVEGCHVNEVPEMICVCVCVCVSVQLSLNRKLICMYIDDETCKTCSSYTGFLYIFQITILIYCYILFHTFNVFSRTTSLYLNDLIQRYQRDCWDLSLVHF